MRKKRTRSGFILLSFVLVLAILYGIAVYPVEVKRVTSPDGQYVAVGSVKLVFCFVPRMPGSGSDAPRDVEIFTQQGVSLGCIPVPIGWMMDELEWHENGADIRAHGEWDFRNRTAFYWSKDGGRRIWTKK